MKSLRQRSLNRVRIIVKKAEVPNPPGSSGAARKRTMLRNGIDTHGEDAIEEYIALRQSRKDKERKARQDKHSMAKANRGVGKTKTVRVVKKIDSAFKRK